MFVQPIYYDLHFWETSIGGENACGCLGIICGDMATKPSNGHFVLYKDR